MRAKKKGENVGWAYQKLNNHTIRPNTLEVPQLHNQACVRWQESSPAGHFSALRLVGPGDGGCRFWTRALKKGGR